MIKIFLRILDKIFPPKEIYAHCDIPCGIYDPHAAQMAAHTVIRMTNMINGLKASSANPLLDERKKIISQITRLTKVKEEHAEIVKHEVRVIWGDYFKPEHIKEHPQLHELVFDIMKLASKARQEIDPEASQQLLTKVQEFAEIFYKTKGIEPIRIKTVYPTEGEIVSYK